MDKQEGKKNSDAYERVDNLILIQDAISHIIYELGGQKNLVRIGIECHSILLRSMVEVLRGSSNLAITGKRPKTWEWRYERGNDPCKIIKEQPIKGCKKAWRFSEPEECAEPIPSDGKPVPDEQFLDDHLLGFYDFLAMVQTECHMGHYYGSKPINISDEDMGTLEWLHENVRNSVEHFIPKLLLVDKESLMRAINICIDVSTSLFAESGMILLMDEEKEICDKLIELKNRLASGLAILLPPS